MGVEMSTIPHTCPEAPSSGYPSGFTATVAEPISLGGGPLELETLRQAYKLPKL